MSGRVLIVTRPGDADEALAQALAALGAEVLEAPAIEFAPMIEQNLAPCRAALHALHAAGGWLVLPSPTAVRHFVALLERLGTAPEALCGVRLAVVGAGSARAAEAAGLRVDWVAPQSRGDALARTLPAVPGTPILIAGSAQTRPELREGLALRGFNVQVLPLYAPRPCRAGLAAIRGALAARPGAVVVVTSPSGVDALLGVARPLPPWAAAARWVAIGPTTERALEQAGVAPDRRRAAVSPDAEGIARAVLALDDPAA